MKNLPISQRLCAVVVNLLIVCAVYGILTHSLPSTFGIETAWIFAAGSYWLLTLLSAPWFLPPRDVLVSCLAALIALLSMDISGAAGLVAELNAIRVFAVIYVTSVAAIATLSVVFNDTNPDSAKSKLCYRLSGTLGSPELLFLYPALISIVAYFQTQPRDMVLLILLWVFMVVMKPVERVWNAIRLFGEERQDLTSNGATGIIERIDHPNILRVKLSDVGAWQPRKLFVASLPDGSERYALALFKQTQGKEVIGTGACLQILSEPKALTPGFVYPFFDEAKTDELLNDLSGSRECDLVGFVVENSSIGSIAFEVSGSVRLQEGAVVFVRVEGKDIFYQIASAETREESFDQNPRGTHIVQATQLGEYSPTEGFIKYSWLPTMNTLVFSAEQKKFDKPEIGDREFGLGLVPSTDVEAVANIDDLIEYHSAVLGVTGTGKTELALSIVQKAVLNGTKVFCVDFTGDYRARLSDLNPVSLSPTLAQAAELERKIFDAETGDYKARAEKVALQKGIDELRSFASSQVSNFLISKDENLAIFELPEIINTRVTLRLTELYLSTIMQWAKEHRREKQILIVLEEAHTIIPETAGSGFDFDTQYVVSKIGQIALQGRKYRVGLMLVSQRTALVSKTILSQCNTFFTHALIDQTSLGFLENVYSSRQTKLIPNLGKFEFLAFGKAIKSDRPITLKRPYDKALEDASKNIKHTPPNEEKEGDAGSNNLSHSSFIWNDQNT